MKLNLCTKTTIKKQPVVWVIPDMVRIETSHCIKYEKSTVLHSRLGLYYVKRANHLVV